MSVLDKFILKVEGFEI